MNEIYIDINFAKGTIHKTLGNLITNDYNSTKLVFTFDREDGTKVFEMKNPDNEVVLVTTITNNEVILVGVDEEGHYVPLFDRAGDYYFEVSLYNGSSKLTSCYERIKVKQEQVVIDGEVITPYLPIFDELLQDINKSINEVNNLDVAAEKEGNTTTITLTKKDGTTETTEILDGTPGQQGEQGIPGQDATVNGYNTLNIVGGTNISIDQVNDTLTINNNYSYDDTVVKQDITNLQGAVTTETTNRTQADINLQTQIDAITSASDVVDIVGTYQDLVNYNTQHIKANDVIKVLQDSTHNNSMAYYRWIITENVGAWVYVGSEGPYYTKSEVDETLTDYVKNTDYASASKGGVIKANVGTGFEVNANSGNPAPTSANYSSYLSASNYFFIGKGTLENVITGKQLVNKTYVDDLVGDIGEVLDTIQGEVI